jgi:hypothetical protein
MSCLNYAIEETTVSTGEDRNGFQGAKLFVAPKSRGRHGDRVVRLVAQVFDAQLARGSMPA